MSQRRQIIIGRYVFSFVVCSCYLIMHYFCDCFTNTKHFPRHLVLSLLLWTLKNSIDRDSLSSTHCGPASPVSLDGYVWRQRSIVLFVCFVLYRFVQPSLLMSFVCCSSSLLSQVLEAEDCCHCRVDQLSILCLHHFICSIEPSLLNLPFFVAFSFYSHRSPELATAHHAL